ncbi:hypothetical protein [Parafilimonas sp.]|uniref:hypothetical protein n=1 Tax=Parafilimonas sp. TaxID=1969739 RepID=UPI003F7D6627
MRLILLLAAIVFSTASMAQVPVFSSNNFMQRPLFNRTININDSGFNNKKWFFTKYSGISTSFSFFKGGNATVIAAPVGIQLNRRLNDNLFAFAGVNAAPAYINFHQAFFNSNIKGIQNKYSFNQHNLGLYSRAEVGLMYVNDAKTFSISGSFGIETNNYPYPYYQSNNTRPQGQIVHPNR